MAIFSINGRVRWFETDTAGVAHFTQFMVYCENLEKELLYSDSINLWEIEDKYNIWIPRVHVECEYKYPLYFHDEYRVDLINIDIGRTSIKFIYEIHNLTRKKHSATCKITLVTVDRGSNRPVEVPNELRSRLEKIIGGSSRG